MPLRRVPILLLSVLFLLLLCACPPRRGPSDDDDSTAEVADCEGVAPLAEVCIEIGPTPSYSLAEVAEGVSVPYVLRIREEVSGVAAWTQDAGGCGQPDESGLILFERLGGNQQDYCSCDEGLCGPSEPIATTLLPGEWPREFTWSGTNWSGPSDTGNPLGAPFPSGVYTLTVSAVGTVDGEEFVVEAQASITLTEGR